MVEGESTTQLADRVGIDDCLDGERSGGKVGRGSENKVPFMAAVETNSHGHPKRVVFSPVKSFSRSEVKSWAQRRLKPSATVVSDGLTRFWAVTSVGCVHQPEIVGTHRKSTDMGASIGSTLSWGI